LIKINQMTILIKSERKQHQIFNIFLIYLLNIRKFYLTVKKQKFSHS